jgi:hypothetical protein
MVYHRSTLWTLRKDRVEKHQLGRRPWIVSIEHDNWAVTGSGFSEAEAYRNLLQNAKAESRAVCHARATGRNLWFVTLSLLR